MSNENPTQKIDVLQMLRDAQGEAAEVTAAQEKLRADANLIGLFDRYPALIVLSAKLDEIRAIVDEVATEAHLLPSPYSLIVQQTAHWIDVADDALKAHK